MSVMKCLQKGLILVLALQLVACVTVPERHTSAFRAAKPRSILVLPPVNVSPDVNAGPSVLAQLTQPIAETGYYVVPVGLMDETFKNNGIQTAHDAQAVSYQKLRDIFGADAALYVEITEFGNSYMLLSAEVVCTLEARLVDLRTGTVIWQGAASASSAEQQKNSNGGGLAGLLIAAAVQQVMNNVVDSTYQYAGIASNRLVSPATILPGPYSPLYGQEGKK